LTTIKKTGTEQSTSAPMDENLWLKVDSSAHIAKENSGRANVTTILTAFHFMKVTEHTL
jgi:hypothetical protein